MTEANHNNSGDGSGGNGGADEDVYTRLERAADLLSERAVQGLDVDAADELDALLSTLPAFDDGAFDGAAAALSCAYERPPPLPSSLRGRLLDDAELFFAGDAEHVSRATEADDASVTASVTRGMLESSRARGIMPALPWLATAAALALAVLGWWPGRGALPVAPPALTLIEQRDAISARPDAVSAAWTPGTWAPAAAPVNAVAGVTGGVVWSDGAQQGFMTLRNLPANDPDVSQYQLWIFDAERDDRYPIDGGLFDVPAGVGDVVVPIQPPVPVGRPVLFAITVESPGGVVVSDRERLVLTAKGEASSAPASPSQ